MAAKTPKHFGVFTRTDASNKTWERTADTPADAVAMTFDGWALKTKATANEEDAARVAADGPAVLGGVPGNTAGDSTTTKSETKPSNK